MFWFILLFPLLIYPWGYDPYYTIPKTAYLQLFVLGTWLYIIIKKRYRSFSLHTPNFKIEYIIILFLCLVCLSTLLSVNIKTSLYGTKDRYEGTLTLFAYCSILLFSYRLIDLKKLGKVLPGMAIVSIVVSSYGILQHYLLDFLPRNSSRINYNRSYAFFDNPNFFGSYLVLIMLLVMALYLTGKNIKITIIYFLIVNLNLVALVFSGTRSGWIGVFCGMVFVTVFVVYKRRNLWLKWAGLITAFGLIIFVINQAENEAYSSRANVIVTDSYKIISNQSTGQEGSSRFLIWKKALPLVKDNFWFGSGPETLQYIFPETPEYKGQIVDKAHNEYLHMAITLGVLAMLTYLLLVAFILRRAFQAVRKADEKEKIILYGLISAIGGYLVQAFFNISVVPVAPFFWAILGITLAKSRIILNNELAHTTENGYATIKSENQIA